VPQVQDGVLTRIDVPDLTLRVKSWSDRIREQQSR
jgi:5-methylthioadenosine/S-adenosylhomocysteine deaminase